MAFHVVVDVSEPGGHTVRFTFDSEEDFVRFISNFVGAAEGFGYTLKLEKKAAPHDSPMVRV